MEIKDLLSYLGVEDVKDLDGFKKTFKEKFVPKSEVVDEEDVKKRVTGKFAGAFTTQAKRAFGLSSDEIKEKSWEDIFELGLQKKDAEIEELKKASTATSPEQIKAWEDKYNKKAKEAEEYKAMAEKTAGELQAEREGFAKEKKGMKVSSIFDKAKEKVSDKLKSDMTEAEKLGYQFALQSLKIDLDDKDQPVVMDKEGKRIPNPNKAGAFLSLEEAIEVEATRLDLIKKNNGGGKPPIVPNNFNGNQNNNNGQNNGQVNNGQPVRQVHPAALKNAELIKASTNK